MGITADTWAVVLATAIGPVVAVVITLTYAYLNETRGAQYNRQLMVFTTLMATRKNTLLREHVTALNMIEVVFYRKPKVLGKWKAYIGHLTDNLPDPNDQDRMAEWSNRQDRLLAALLFEISKVLRFKIPEIEIFQGGYESQGWTDRDDMERGALKFLNDLRTSQTALPLWMMGPTELWRAQQSKPDEPESQS